MVADALVYHPVVTHYLRYVATTVGRDKILRTVQYFSRFYAWYLYRTNNPKTAIQPWATLKSQLGLTRKIMRIGKWIEHLRAASELYDAATKSGSGDKITQYLQILRQLGYAGYLFFDMLTVGDAMGVKKLANVKKLQANAAKAWFTGLVASILNGLYANYRLRQRATAITEKDAEGKVEGVKIARQRKVFNRQLVSDLCDIVNPATAIGYAHFDDGVIGLAGLVSSFLGMYGAWQKTA